MTSNEKKTRRYELKERARRLEDTRRRITEAAVELHGSVGPARTTVSEIAKRAGVRRMTVYNHFPTDAELLDACSSHWVSRNLPPDPASWAGIEDPDVRTYRAIAEMYAYYRRSGEMLEHTLRDGALVPALDEILDRKWWPVIERVVDSLMVGRGASSTGEGGSAGTRGPAPVMSEVRAALRLAVDFWTWRTLTDEGLGDEEAAALQARMVASLGAPGSD